MANLQHIRIKMVICPEKMGYVAELFRQSDWTLTEVGDPQELQDEIAELYNWTLDVTEDQKEAIQYLVTGHVTTIWDEPPQMRRGARKIVLELTEEQEARVREVMEDENWDAGQIVRGYLEEEDEQQEQDQARNPENQPMSHASYKTQITFIYSWTIFCHINTCISSSTNFDYSTT